MSDSDEKYFDDRLQCYADTVVYHFKSRSGELRIGGCCDMTGCVKLFRGIDPDVVEIKTYSGNKPDTIYRKSGTKWESFSADGVARGSVEEENFYKDNLIE